MEIFNLKKHLKNLPKEGKILVAPLDWGIGHATRCIPIIQQLINQNFTPIMASSGKSLVLLQKVFPNIESISLPAYDILYAKNPKFFTLKLLVQVPRLIKTYKTEKKKIDKLVSENKINAIISDNRFGVFHEEIPSIYITHQLRVLSGMFTSITTFFHQKIINKFDVCWVPDVASSTNLSGDLSHRIKTKIPPIYIGVLSPLVKEELPIKYDILFLLSGPEPQRTLLEEKIKSQFHLLKKRVCLIRGVIEKEVHKSQKDKVTTYNYLLGKDLNKVINQSQLVVARSGYSTIMDLVKLKKKAFFIPTPGQTEQLYLAEYLKEQGIAGFSLQKEFLIGLIT
ncbi:MAG TPA: glycosyltransferase [Lutibacter sp.]|nr:glycosyltransferase [Lutibacter sp.]